MPKKEPETEKTPKGLEVPIAKRGEFFDNLKKIARPKRKDREKGARKRSS